MAGLTCFFDTSVLLAGTIELAGPKHPAQQLMSLVAAGHFHRPATAWHCCLEYYSVATRLPGEVRLTPAVAARFVEKEIEARFIVYGLARTHRQSFIRNAAADGIWGGRIYDAHISEIARSTGADVIITDNRKHFLQMLRYGVRVLSSEEAAAELA